LVEKLLDVPADRVPVLDPEGRLSEGGRVENCGDDWVGAIGEESDGIDGEEAGGSAETEGLRDGEGLGGSGEIEGVGDGEGLGSGEGVGGGRETEGVGDGEGVEELAILTVGCWLWCM